MEREERPLKDPLTSLLRLYYCCMKRVFHFTWDCVPSCKSPSPPTVYTIQLVIACNPEIMVSSTLGCVACAPHVCLQLQDSDTFGTNWRNPLFEGPCICRTDNKGVHITAQTVTLIPGLLIYGPWYVGLVWSLFCIRHLYFELYTLNAVISTPIMSHTL